MEQSLPIRGPVLALRFALFVRYHNVMMDGTNIPRHGPLVALPPAPPPFPKLAPRPEAVEDRLYRLREERLHHRDSRPQRLDEIVGQREALDHVNVLLNGPDPQHMLFLGPPGCGKTTLARIAFEAAKLSPKSAFAEDAPFVTIDGATMLYDERNHIGGLTTFVFEAFYGSVRDRNEQKGREGVPELVFGACARAHLGVLFIDEIGEVDPAVLTSLLKVLEEHKETLTSSSSMIITRSLFASISIPTRAARRTRSSRRSMQ